MKLSKNEFTLCEQDALQDVLEMEKKLMEMYSISLYEGSSKIVRKAFSENLIATASTQYNVFSAMQERGYYEPQPAQKNMVDEVVDKFKKTQKTLAE